MKRTKLPAILPDRVLRLQRQHSQTALAQLHLYLDDLLSDSLGKPMRRGALTIPALIAQAPPVFAHRSLERASPPVGSEAAAASPELSITFTEGKEPSFSTIEVRGLNGAQRSPRASRIPRPIATGG